MVKSLVVGGENKDWSIYHTTDEILHELNNVKTESYFLEKGGHNQDEVSLIDDIFSVGLFGGGNGGFFSGFSKMQDGGQNNDNGASDDNIMGGFSFRRNLNDSPN
jgi:hypothetical protein